MKPEKKRILALLFAAYVLVMLWLLYGQRARIIFPSAGAYYGDYLVRLKQNYNLIPFKTVLAFVRRFNNSNSAYLVRHAFINLAGNIVLFVPLGVFLPYFFPKLRRFRFFAAMTAAIITAVELLQWITLLGSADIDDLILNVFGWFDIHEPLQVAMMALSVAIIFFIISLYSWTKGNREAQKLNQRLKKRNDNES